MLIQIETKLTEIKDILEKSNIQSVAQRSLPASISYPKEHDTIIITTERKLNRTYNICFFNGIFAGIIAGATILTFILYSTGKLV